VGCLCCSVRPLMCSPNLTVRSSLPRPIR
jgi:hypothetical protein